MLKPHEQTNTPTRFTLALSPAMLTLNSCESNYREIKRLILFPRAARWTTLSTQRNQSLSLLKRVNEEQSCADDSSFVFLFLKANICVCVCACVLILLDVLPHGVHVSRRQTRAADRRAVVGPHYSLGEQEIAEQAGHQQVLTEQLLKQI